MVIDERLQAFIASPVMTIVAVRASSGMPTIARGLAGRSVNEGSDIDLLISRRQWPEATAGLAPGTAVTATFSRATDYRTVQIKGIVRHLVEADAADRVRADSYLSDVLDMLHQLGVGSDQVCTFLSTEDLMRLRYRPTAVFLQTPGSGAGSAMQAAS